MQLSNNEQMFSSLSCKYTSTLHKNPTSNTITTIVQDEFVSFFRSRFTFIVKKLKTVMKIAAVE